MFFMIEKTGLGLSLGSPAKVMDSEIEEMMKAGVHIGHSRSKNHPAMKPFIFGVRNNVSIIDLLATKEKLTGALEFLKKAITQGGLVLLVGTRPSASRMISDLAKKTNMPFFAERWIGGTLTNFKSVVKRVEHLEKLERERASGGFEKYTKKERMLKNEEIEKLDRMFGGIRPLKRLPAAVFVTDITKDEIAVREAKKVKIPVMALVDSNSNAVLIDWPIPANDDALPALRYMLERLERVIIEAQKNIVPIVPEVKPEAKPESKESK